MLCRMGQHTSRVSTKSIMQVFQSHSVMVYGLVFLCLLRDIVFCDAKSSSQKQMEFKNPDDLAKLDKVISSLESLGLLKDLSSNCYSKPSVTLNQSQGKVILNIVLSVEADSSDQGHGCLGRPGRSQEGIVPTESWTEMVSVTQDTNSSMVGNSNDGNHGNMTVVSDDANDGE